MSKALNKEGPQLAGQYFGEGLNCCESTIKAVLELTDLNLPPQVVNMGKYFRQGLGSGCACGALVGGVMMLGMLKPEAGENLGNRLHEKFKEEFGSTCCRVIRQKQGMLNRMINGKCRDITAKTMELMWQVWEKA